MQMIPQQIEEILLARMSLEKRQHPLVLHNIGYICRSVARYLVADPSSQVHGRIWLHRDFRGVHNCWPAVEQHLHYNRRDVELEGPETKTGIPTAGDIHKRSFRM